MPGAILAPGLYGMADAGCDDPVSLARILFSSGCRVVQLRAKGWAEDRLVEAARQAVAHAHAHDGILIVNDHPRVAAAAGAHGVHLGQDDAPIAEARGLLPAGALIGRSTHTLEQVEAAQDADYIGFGPVFGTRSKTSPWSDRGVRMLEQAVRLSRVPVVAIGGIDPENVELVRQAGAWGWAVISGLWGAADREDALRRLLPHN